MPVNRERHLPKTEEYTHRLEAEDRKEEGRTNAKEEWISKN
jgi:hypothetical protein